MINNRFPLKQANIVIVYENNNDISTLVKAINGGGYTNINKIVNSEFSITAIKENIPDLILIYFSISKFDAYEKCRTIKTNNDFNEIPIIVVSDYKNINKEMIYEIGVEDYLTIPVNQFEIRKRIENCLKYKFMEEEVKKIQTIATYNELVNLNESLKDENRKLRNQVIEKQNQLENIDMELEEFNDLLTKEIKERIKTEEALEKSEKQFRYSIEEAPVPIMLYNEVGEIKAINRHWSEITGYTIDDISTVSGWGKVSDIFKENLFSMKNCNDVDFEENHNKGEFLVRTRYGNIKSWDFYMACIENMNDVHKLFVILAIDITEKKNMEKLQKSIEEKRKKIYKLKKYNKIRTEFFANMSHELRTPINVIFSALQMFELSLKEYQLKNRNIDKNKYIKIMKQNCYRILRLINNIIDMTKIEAGYVIINEQHIEIVSFIQNISSSVAEFVESKGLSLDFNSNIEKKVIACDPEKIERIILNLLSNSIKFTSFGGEIKITIEENVDNVCIRVKDTGKGIPKEKLKSIFDRFVQVNKSLVKDHEGSGIGLSIVKSLVELHGGKILVKSDLEQGAEFIIYIPCKLMEEIPKETIFLKSLSDNNIEKINIELSDICY